MKQFNAILGIERRNVIKKGIPVRRFRGWKMIYERFKLSISNFFFMRDFEGRETELIVKSYFTVNEKGKLVIIKQPEGTRVTNTALYISFDEEE